MTKIAAGPRLTPRERVFLVLYRTLSEADRRTVDRVLGATWTAGSGRRPHAVSNKRFTVALRQLNAGDIGPEWLAHFVDMPSAVSGRAAGTRRRLSQR
jgi:hypothetical protein